MERSQREKTLLNIANNLIYQVEAMVKANDDLDWPDIPGVLGMACAIALCWAGKNWPEHAIPVAHSVLGNIIENLAAADIDVVTPAVNTPAFTVN
jgi:hypothetical protein